MSKSLKCISKQIFCVHVLLNKNVILCHKLFYSEQASATIDNFTESLVLQKGLKWDNLLKLTDKQSVKPKPILKSYKTKLESEKDTNVMHLVKNKAPNVELMTKNIDECLKVNNIPQLIINLNVCKNENCCPSKEQLLLLAKHFTINKNKQGIKILQHLCKKNYPLEYKAQSHYDHFIAEIIWTEGNVKESLNLLGTVYCDNIMLRKQLQITLCNCFSQVIISHGEASRVIVTDFVKMFADKHNDYNLMAYFWKVLFESEWFSDQQLSITLLKDYNQLKDMIGWMLPMMGRQLLQEHKIDTFHRLIEVLLSNDMKHHCGYILRLFFNYKYNIGDLQGCSSIVKACSDLDLTLTERQEKRFLQMLLNTKPKVVKPEEFQFKF